MILATDRVAFSPNPSPGRYQTHQIWLEVIFVQRLLKLVLAIVVCLLIFLRACSNLYLAQLAILHGPVVQEGGPSRFLPAQPAHGRWSVGPSSNTACEEDGRSGHFPAWPGKMAGWAMGIFLHSMPRCACHRQPISYFANHRSLIEISGSTAHCTLS